MRDTYELQRDQALRPSQHSASLTFFLTCKTLPKEPLPTVEIVRKSARETLLFPIEECLIHEGMSDSGIPRFSASLSTRSLVCESQFLALPSLPASLPMVYYLVEEKGEGRDGQVFLVYTAQAQAK